MKTVIACTWCDGGYRAGLDRNVSIGRTHTDTPAGCCTPSHPEGPEYSTKIEIQLTALPWLGLPTLGVLEGGG